MKQNGWRKPTPGLAKAEQHAQAGEHLAIPKSQAVVAVKKVAAAIGLKAPDMLLLDTLAAVTQPQDWEQGRRPIVWASNAFLEEQTGFSLAALRRHVRRLCEAGVLSMKDSPNGKRWGKRDEDGVIIEAYGFDLAPLAARAEEFEALHAHLVEERAFCQSLRTTITITRRIIRAKIEKALESHLKGPWRELQDEFAMMVQGLPTRSDGAEKLLNVVEWFKALQDKVEEAFTAAFEWPEESDAKSSTQEIQQSSNVVPFNQKMTPRDIENDTHILTTTEPDSVKSNCFEEKHTADPVPETQPPASGGSPDVDLDTVKWDVRAKQPEKGHVELATVMAACPAFAKLAHSLVGYIKNWEDLHRAASQIRPIIGISEDAWNVSQQKLGPYVAAAAITLIYDKLEKDEIASAGGYLRGMVGKALDGELHLDRSFYGRLNGAGSA